MTRHTRGRGALDSTQFAATVPGEHSRWPFGLMTVGMRLGRYTIARPLGRGSMGYVYAAHDGQLDRQIALKILQQHDERAAQLIIREAQALARLDDPHVVKVYDAGELDGHMFIAMQLVDGENLATVLARRSPSIAQVVGWFIDAGRGLASAHAAGLIHRDFKPGNVLIDRAGKVAVSDFGLACDVAEVRGPTSRGIMVGTPAYMSPEQHELQTPTEASDQFSFCLALWEAVVRRHPFIDGDPATMSPFAIGHQIVAGALIPPPPDVRVPRRLVDVLTRGLARDPAARWQSMGALLAQLAPAQPRRRIWPYVAASVVAAGAAGAAAMALWHHGATRPACAAIEGDRARAAWSPELARRIDAAFDKTGRDYAPRAAHMVTAALDGYAGRWRELAAEVCTAERASRRVPELVARRRACLDQRLDALRGLAGALAGAATPELVDRADAIAGTLPELGDCDGDAPSVPPADRAEEIAKLEVDLGNASLHELSGDAPRAKAEAAAVAARADALGWPSLQVRAATTIGRAEVVLMEPAREPLIHAAELAVAHHLDRLAAETLSVALLAITDGAEIAVISGLAHAEAQRAGSRAVELTVDIAEGRALARARLWNEAAAKCRAAEQTARERADAENHLAAEDCLYEALMPLGAYKEVEPLLEAMIAESTQQFGADHPAIADYLSGEVEIAVQRGKPVKARSAAERELAIRQKMLPPTHFKIAVALGDLGGVATAEGHDDDAEALYERALALTDASRVEQVTTIAGLHQGIALIEGAKPGPQHLAVALDHLGRAVGLLRARHPDGADLGVLLVSYGQVEARVDAEASLAMLREARAILERHHDKRAVSATIAIAIDAFHAGHFDEARATCEDALAHVDPDTTIDQLAIAKSTLARALAASRGDRARIRTLAAEARDLFAKLGPDYEANVAMMNNLMK